MQIIKEIPQQSQEWFELRAKRMTASNAQAIGNNGAGLETYIIEMMAQYYSKTEQERYSNPDLERGNTREPQARFLYANSTGFDVEEVCFVIKNDYIGASPDGLVGKDGLVEFKSPSDTNYFKLLLEYNSTGSFTIKPEYIWQCQMQMEVCERKWVDFCNYNPNYKTQLLVKRIYPDKEYFEKLQRGYGIGIERIKRIEQLYENKVKKTG